MQIRHEPRIPRSPTVHQLKLILRDQGRQRELDLITGHPPAWAGVPTHAELHLLSVDGGKLILVVVVVGVLAEVVEAQAVEGWRVWVEVGIVGDGKGRDKDHGSVRDKGAIGEGDVFASQALECGCFYSISIVLMIMIITIIVVVMTYASGVETVTSWSFYQVMSKWTKEI